MGRPADPAWNLPFKFAASPDGSVRYLDDTQLNIMGYLAFSLDLSWETEVSADRAAMDVIHQALWQDAFVPARLALWGRADLLLNEWRGVSTDAFGRVTHLELAVFGLDGHIPEAVGDLNAFQMLQLGTTFSGMFPTRLARVSDSLCRLTNLKDLDLSWQPVEGHLPAFWSQLENL